MKGVGSSLVLGVRQAQFGRPRPAWCWVVLKNVNAQRSCSGIDEDVGGADNVVGGAIGMKGIQVVHESKENGSQLFFRSFQIHDEFFGGGVGVGGVLDDGGSVSDGTNDVLTGTATFGSVGVGVVEIAASGVEPRQEVGGGHC